MVWLNSEKIATYMAGTCIVGVVVEGIWLQSLWQDGKNIPFWLVAGIVAAVLGLVANIIFLTRFSVDSPPASEVDLRRQRETRHASGLGLIIGVVIAVIAGLLGIVPVHELKDWGVLIVLGALAGTIWAQHSVSLKHDRLTPADAGLFGVLIGAIVLFCATVVYVFVIYGNYDAATNTQVALKGCAVFGIVQVWRRCAQLRMYSRVRLVIGLLLSTVGGIVFTSAFGILVFPTFWQSMVHAYGEIFVRAWLVGGALLGCCIYLIVRFGKLRGLPLRSLLFGTVAGLTATFDIVGKVGLFLVGVCFMVGAVPVWWLGSWWFSHLGILAELKDITGYAIYGFSILMFVQGLRLVLAVLKGTPQLANVGAHGQADIATEGKAALHERGEGGRSKVHTQRF
jgi:hypothetical protein